MFVACVRPSKEVYEPGRETEVNLQIVKHYVSARQRTHEATEFNGVRGKLISVKVKWAAARVGGTGKLLCLRLAETLRLS
jgi:hypothetical protein